MSNAVFKITHKKVFFFKLLKFDHVVSGLGFLHMAGKKNL